jgi:hypothetical protein
MQVEWTAVGSSALLKLPVELLDEICTYFCPHYVHADGNKELQNIYDAFLRRPYLGLWVSEFEVGLNHIVRMDDTMPQQTGPDPPLAEQEDIRDPSDERFRPTMDWTKLVLGCLVGMRKLETFHLGMPNPAPITITET